MEECYEFLFLILTACEDGVTTFCESGGLKVLSSQMLAMRDGNNFDILS